MNTNCIHNEDCLFTMKSHIDPKSVDIVMTSPPYCTSNRAGKKSKATLTTERHSKSNYYPSLRYDVYNDNLTPEEYVGWTLSLFDGFDRVLKENGCILYNISYSSTRRDMLFSTIAAIIEQTPFSVMDMIVWKKRNALPNNTSPNKLTRIVEPVFVFARESESDTFICNKKVTSVREATGQKMYENVFNFVEAANNDGANNLNKATYSSELCEKMLGLYGRSGMVVYDPFMGTGTTGVACKRLGMQYIGSELSVAQTEFARKRIESDDGRPRDYSQQTADDKPRKAKGASRSAKGKALQALVVDDPRFKQLELFDDGGAPNVAVFGSVTTAATAAAEATETANAATEGVEFSSQPMSAIEEELSDEFADVDADVKARGVRTSPVSPDTSACPVSDDEFE